MKLRRPFLPGTGPDPADLESSLHSSGRTGVSPTVMIQLRYFRTSGTVPVSRGDRR